MLFSLYLPIAFLWRFAKCFSLSICQSSGKIFTNTPAQFKWRILSCFCSAPDECKCYGPQSVTMCKGPTTANRASNIDVPLMDAQAGFTRVTEITDQLKGCWCAVKYDREVYPGIVQDVDAENCILVQTMSRVGQNHYFWPMRDDILWYQPHDFLGLIPPPQPVTKRHMMLPVDVWEKLFSHW